MFQNVTDISKSSLKNVSLSLKGKKKKSEVVPRSSLGPNDTLVLKVIDLPEIQKPSRLKKHSISKTSSGYSSEDKKSSILLLHPQNDCQYHSPKYSSLPPVLPCREPKVRRSKTGYMPRDMYMGPVYPTYVIPQMPRCDRRFYPQYHIPPAAYYRRIPKEVGCKYISWEAFSLNN